MDILFPSPPGLTGRPRWTGTAFQIGDTTSRFLTYDVGAAGWSADLNDMFDDNGGENHYINIGSRRNTIRALDKWLLQPRPHIVEIGCASGYMLQTLRQKFPDAAILGADPFQHALNAAAQKVPDVPLLQFDILKCPLPDSFADALVILNVLEHIGDDEGALAQVFRILRPGGIACIEVPAGPGLFDLYDRTLRHFRRYSMKGLVAKAEHAGFEILERSHIGFFVYPAFWAVKKRNRRYDRLPLEQQRQRVLENIHSSGNSGFMHWLMALENWCRRFVYLPCGIRCFVVCRRP